MAVTLVQRFIFRVIFRNEPEIADETALLVRLCLRAGWLFEPSRFDLISSEKLTNQWPVLYYNTFILCRIQVFTLQFSFALGPTGPLDALRCTHTLASTLKLCVLHDDGEEINL